jgi:hypothetical protein
MERGICKFISFIYEQLKGVRWGRLKKREDQDSLLFTINE